jgi:hypothetical protein
MFPVADPFGSLSPVLLVVSSKTVLVSLVDCQGESRILTSSGLTAGLDNADFSARVISWHLQGAAPDAQTVTQPVSPP